MNILILTEGDEENGLGHVTRQFTLGLALYKERRDVVSYLVRSGTPGELILNRFMGNTFNSIGVFSYHGDRPSLKNFAELSPDVCIIDIEHGPTKELLLDAKKHSCKLVVVGGVGFAIHDQASIDALVDLQIYQSPALNYASISQTVTRHLIGLNYLILDEAFLNARAVYTLRQNEPVNKKHILVSMGGADPHNLTWELSDALAQAFPAMQIISVYGPAAKKATRKIVSPNVTIIESPPPSQFAQLMSESCLIVTALGMTVYEAMCVGVPVACTAWSKDHEDTALRLAQLGAITYLGVWHELDKGEMFAFAHNMTTTDRYRRMRTKTSHNLIDGLGTGRVVKALEELGNE